MLKQVRTRTKHYCKSCGEEIVPKSLAWFYYRTKTTSRWCWFHDFCFRKLVEAITDHFGFVFADDLETTKSAKRRTIVTLCGSTRFKKEYEAEQKRLTLENKIVISVGLFGHSGDSMTAEQKVALDSIHLEKIDLADYIVVINPGGYIGNSTRKEIDYALSIGKTVVYYEQKGGD